MALFNNKNGRKRPLPNLWYTVYGHIVRQGHFLSGHPISFANDLISIPSGSDRRFKFYMAWFTFYNFLYVLNYIPILVWGTEDDLKTYSLYTCHTLVHLCMWILLCMVLVKRHAMCPLFNAGLQFSTQFNGKNKFNFLLN
jgi:hypothetical protein